MKSFLVSTCILLLLSLGIALYTKKTNVETTNSTPNQTEINFSAQPEEPKPIKILPEITEKIFTDYKLALDASKKLDKPMLLFFESNNCVYCKKMKTNIFEDSDTQKKLLSEYVVCYVNTADGNYAKSYKIKLVPTYVVVSPNGDVLLRGVGLKSKDDFINWLKPKEVSYLE